MPNTRLIDDLDDLSATIEKLEHVIDLAFFGGAQDNKSLLTITIISDYVGQLRQLSTHLSEREACR